MTRLNAFDAIAPFYDVLARTVFGEGIRDAQRRYLSLIKPGGKILILGGGTGWILPAITSIAPACEVWYIEASSGMLKLAKKRLEGRCNNIHFVHGTEADIPEGTSFDAIVTNFYLDLFSSTEISVVAATLAGCLSDEGVLLVSDFVSEKWWHRRLLSIMYFFFHLSCGIDNRRLPDWRSAMLELGMEERRAAQFSSGFIVSAAYYRRLRMVS